MGGREGGRGEGGLKVRREPNKAKTNKQTELTGLCFEIWWVGFSCKETT